MAEIFTFKSNYNPRQSREDSGDVRLATGNGSPPVVWIISLYL